MAGVFWKVWSADAKMIGLVGAARPGVGAPPVQPWAWGCPKREAGSLKVWSNGATGGSQAAAGIMAQSGAELAVREPAQ